MKIIDYIWLLMSGILLLILIFLFGKLPPYIYLILIMGIFFATFMFAYRRTSRNFDAFPEEEDENNPPSHDAL